MPLIWARIQPRVSKAAGLRAGAGTRATRSQSWPGSKSTKHQIHDRYNHEIAYFAFVNSTSLLIYPRLSISLFKQIDKLIYANRFIYKHNLQIAMSSCKLPYSQILVMEIRQNYIISHALPLIWARTQPRVSRAAGGSELALEPTRQGPRAGRVQKTQNIKYMIAIITKAPTLHSLI